LSALGILVLKQQGLISLPEKTFLFQLVQAFTASMVFNLLPGPMVIIYHKFTDTYIQICEGKVSQLKEVKFSQVIKRIDWVELFQFVILNLILFIPINTVVFLVPQDQRVLLAAYSSILLGMVLGYHKVNSESPVT
ncbi:MAG TPA: hypothetical protein PKC47_01060, partial [Petrimonas sp.]|nr:hypothetical protein [Petrimonas sp.]